MILPIFPEGGLTSSVITTVWVGVFILAFFNLRFGWVLSGLVVPGYIVPLLILRPVAAAVITLEAVLTYLIVYWFSERIARGRFNALFGRDRFMGLVLASIAVRVTFDGWLLPDLAEWLNNHGYGAFDWHSNLQSFGLVVISLMANQLWKPGLVRGLVSSAVVIGLTFLVVRFGLMEFTNFRLSGVTYVYEGLASSILASPKAYIILVLTAFIASQMNLRYGWDFSGILIPALIALQWYQPEKILSSFVEAGVIYFLAQLVMKLPLLANTTIEGARKLVLFFNVSFAYKLLVGHALNWLALDIKTTDFYGFGYLLSTLLAIKAYDKDIFPRVMRSTFEVSVVGALAGNLAGFALALLLPSSNPGTAALAAARTGAEQGETTGRLLAAASGDAWLRRNGLAAPAAGRAELGAVKDAIELLESGVKPQFIAPGLARHGYELTVQEDGTIALARRNGLRRDLLLFNPAASRSLSVVVADAAAQPGLASGALVLFRKQNARWLVIGAPDGEEPPVPLAALRVLAAGPELLLVPGASPRLVVAGAGATALDLTALRRDLPGVQVNFEREGSADRAVLAINRAALARLAAIQMPATTLVDCAIPIVRTAFPQERDLAQLAFARFEIADLLGAALHSRQPLPAMARLNAGEAGLSLDRCIASDREAWLLSSDKGRQGSFLFDPTADDPRVVEVAAERLRPVDAAWALQRSWKAQALLVAPSEPALVDSQRSLFGVISQSLIRSAGDQPGQVIQLRSAPPDIARGTSDRQISIVTDVLEKRGWMDQLIALARTAGFAAVPVDRGARTAGLEVAPNMSLRYLDQVIGWRHATFWLMARPSEPSEAAPPAASGTEQ